KGLLQVIDPTFKAYHVAGTPHSVTDPVANITAAANYAAHRYGSIDNVHSAY
ncbi:transglycosylase SLT domain-containing protein, partial [Streptomyces kebangsaanensis]